ncbi:MAG: hypothetical protein WCL04_09640 [Verrucomicrobiota bacterium]
MKTKLTFAALLVVAPLVAATTLVCWEPARWGGSISPLAIATMAFFGVLSVPLWPTYIPALIITPLVMKRVSASRVFMRLPLPALMGVSLLVGALAGFGVIMPVVPELKDSDLVLMWASAGAAAGAVTLTLIFLIHRFVPSPDTPPPIPPSTKG